MSSNEVAIQPTNQAFAMQSQQPGRGLSASVNAGAVAIESERAIAEARGQIQVAQMFPRDVVSARAELMAECDVIEFASVAFYAVPRAGSTVTGPSIRLAEACASAYGHMEWGHRELSRGDGKSEVEVYAWDKQKNNRRIRQITVAHVLDTKNGPRPLRDGKDIDDKIANVASKQMRGAILALVPKSFVESAAARCRATLAGGGGVPLKVRIEKMTDAFSKIGVNAETLKKKLKKPLSDITADDLVDLIAIHAAISKNGDKISDHFGGDEDESAATGVALAAAAAAAKAKADADAKAKADADAKAASDAGAAATEAESKATAKTTRAATKTARPAPAPEPEGGKADAEQAASPSASPAASPAVASTPAQQPQAEQQQADDEHAGSGGNDDIF